MRKLVTLLSFFLGTPLLIIVCLVYFSYLSYHKGGAVLGESTEGIAYAALPETENIIEATIGQEESKVEIVRQFFARYSSPLEPYAPDIVAAAERYGLDHRLLPAIAMQESNLCRRVIKDSHNCWGWGIHGTKVTKFSNYPEAIETVSKGLGTRYKVDNGLITPSEIARLYNPSNTDNWIGSVNHFMDQLK